MKPEEPAFPVISERCGEYSGMSLHSYIWSQQTAAWIVALGMRFKEQGATDEAMIDYAVEYGKRTADAMLKAMDAAVGGKGYE